MRSTWLRPVVCVVGLLLAAGLCAAAPPSVSVAFAPATSVKWSAYGASESRVLRDAIVAAVTRAGACTRDRADLEITVTVEEATPTHPTAAQLAADPALSPTRSKLLGGARLRAEVRDSGQHPLTTVGHSYFARTLALGSSSLDPWADARLAIDQFAVKLAAACRELPPG
jgi:hypothetical protein